MSERDGHELCPKCGRTRDPEAAECPGCGVIYSKVSMSVPDKKMRSIRFLSLPTKRGVIRTLSISLIVAIIEFVAIGVYFGRENKKTVDSILDANIKKYEDKARALEQYKDYVLLSERNKSRTQDPILERIKPNLKQAIERIYFDPYSLRNVSYSNPLITVSSYKICIECNAKNKYGAYVGLNRMLFVFDPQLNLIEWHESDSTLCESQWLTYYPWPEMEGKN